MHRGRGRSVRTAANSLVVDSGGLPGALRWKPVVADIVSKRKFAGDAVELRRESAVRSAHSAIIGKENGIKADPREGRALVFPGGSCGLDCIIERNAQRVIARFNECLASVPVHADRWLACGVLA